VKVMAPHGSLADLQQQLAPRVVTGFREGQILGRIWSALDTIVDTYLKQNGVSIRGPQGNVLMGDDRDPLNAEKLDRVGVIDLLMSTGYREKPMETTFPGATLAELQGRVNTVKVTLARYISNCSPEELITLDEILDHTLVRPNLKRQIRAAEFSNAVARTIFTVMIDLNVVEENHQIITLVNYKDRANTNDTFKAATYAARYLTQVN
jgi:hypothetical protein